MRWTSIKATGRNLDDFIRQIEWIRRLHWTERLGIVHEDLGHKGIMAVLLGLMIAGLGLLILAAGALSCALRWVLTF